MNEQCGHGHGSWSGSEPYHHIFLSVEGPVRSGVIFSITQRLILSASNKIFVNLITATSVIVVVTGNGDKGRKREVRQHMSPFLTAKKEKDGNSFLNRGQN